jgi:hypothetical protein
VELWLNLHIYGKAYFSNNKSAAGFRRSFRRLYIQSREARGDYYPRCCSLSINKLVFVQIRQRNRIGQRAAREMRGYQIVFPTAAIGILAIY